MTENAKQHRQRPAATARARSLRRDAPIPERILWGLLRDRRLDGLKFRRQHPVGRYVADFYCAEASLIIELDGMSHDGCGDYDDQRTADIEREGMRVVRVTNDDLLNHADAVAEHIAASARERLQSDPHPSPLPDRERG